MDDSHQNKVKIKKLNVFFSVYDVYYENKEIEIILFMPEPNISAHAQYFLP